MTARKGIRIPWKRPAQGPREELQGFVAGLASRALNILDLPERKAFLENEIARAFRFKSARILQHPEGAERFSPESTRVRNLLTRILGILDGTRKPFLNAAVCEQLGISAILRQVEGTYALAIRQGEKDLGVLVLDTEPRLELGPEQEEALLALCGQLAVVLENSNLLRGKLGLERALQEQARMVQLGEMTARIAHEIKNPLSSIKTIVQVLREEPAMPGEYAKDLELVNSEVDRLAASVGQLLDFARPASRSDRPVRLREVAESVLTFLARDMEALRVRVANEIPSGLAPVAGDIPLYREILLNLLLNAFQAGGPGTQVLMNAWEGVIEDGPERFTLLIVEDDGPGIPAETQPKIFMPFFTTRQRGTGLGLAIVKRNVEHLGGQITVESPVKNGRGTRFLMHLPQVREGGGEVEVQDPDSG